jgi:lysophospholipase L1-like esterase
MKYILHLILCWILSPALCQNTFSPEDPLIRYKGRWSFEDPVQPSASMNGTSIEWAFDGTGTEITLSTATKTVYLFVIVDGQADVFNRQLIQVSQSSPQTFQLAEGLEPGAHYIEIIQLSEYDSKLVFHQLTINDGSLIELPPRKALKLEFYGDSNTAGWNAWNPYDTGGPEASEAFFSFPGLVADMLNAEYHLIGVSGSGITNRTWLNLADSYDLIHITEEKSSKNTWDFQNNFADFIPDAVIVNLGANDYYAGAPKPIIKQEWKMFISDKLRVQYPDAHIVLANSYGWAINEPADYVHEAIEELQAAGDVNVSYVRFPWLWGQEHAVINEHAGFANILATHLAEILNTEMPQPSSLSSIVGSAEIYNGSFEKSILENTADGWRPKGKVTLLTTEEALSGQRVIQVEDGGRVHFATPLNAGTRIRFSVSAKGNSDLSDGWIKILFKNQGQETIKTAQIRPDFANEWQAFSVEETAPAGTWSAWLTLETAEACRVMFDQAELETLDPLGVNENDFKIYPNPFDAELIVDHELDDFSLTVYNPAGQIVGNYRNQRIIETDTWKDGLFFLEVPQANYIQTFIKSSRP